MGRRTWLAAVAAGACAALVGCGGGSEQLTEPPYTAKTIQLGFVKAADLGKGAVLFEDDGHSAGHINYTPADSVPTCPYVQRADDTEGSVEPALVLDGGTPTGRFIVAPRDAAKTPLPVVTEGAVVFPTELSATAAMEKVGAELAKCPATFTILGGPPGVTGQYSTNSRPLELEGWTGFIQQVAHITTDGLDTEYYDDLQTIVVRKANAILYAGFTETKKRGERASAGEKAEQLMERTLARLG